MTARPLTPIVPASAVPSGRQLAKVAGRRPLPLARPVPAPPTPEDVVYGIGRIDSSGRIADRAVTTALGWRAGDRLTLTADAGVVTARRDPGGIRERRHRRRSRCRPPISVAHSRAQRRSDVRFLDQGGFPGLTWSFTAPGHFFGVRFVPVVAPWLLARSCSRAGSRAGSHARTQQSGAYQERPRGARCGGIRLGARPSRTADAAPVSLDQWSRPPARALGALPESPIPMPSAPGPRARHARARHRDCRGPASLLRHSSPVPGRGR